MVGGAEELGALATAGLAAREIEGATGGATAHGHDGGCANCGERLVGHYCHGCGQRGHVHRTAGAFLHEIGHGVFHFEGKVWHTLPLLALKPGELTRRYVEGERARFVSPIALFLFSVFLMFASLALVVEAPDLGGVSAGPAVLRDRVVAERKAAGERIVKLERGRRKDLADGDRADADEKAADLVEARKDFSDLSNAARVLGGGASAVPRGRDDDNGLKVNSGSKALDDKVRHAFDNPQLAIYKLKSAAYKFSWALIPISLPFIWLLFPFSRRYGMYDHAIFATYSLSFMTLLVVAASFASFAGASPALFASVLLFLPPIHIFLQLKGAYRLSTLGAFVRTWLLLVATTITLTLFALLLLYLGLA